MATGREAADKWKAQGNAAFSAKNFTEAISCFSQAIDNAEDDHVLYSNRSGAYAAMGLYDDALEDAATCVALNPDWGKGYSRMGFAQLQLGKPEEALETYQKGEKIDPNNQALKEGIQNCLQAIRIKKLQESNPMSAFTLPAETFKDNPALYKYAQEDPEFMQKVSQGLLTMMMHQDPDSPPPMPDDPKVEEALQWFVVQKELRRQEMETKRREEQMEQDKKKRETEEQQKRDEAEAAMTPEQKQADTHKVAGNELYKNKKFDEAIAEYDKANQLYPQDLTYRINKATVYLEKGEPDKCLEELDKCLEDKSKYSASFETVGKILAKKAACYRRMDKIDEAIECYEKSLLEHNVRQTRAVLSELQRLKDKKQKEAYIDPVKAEEHRLRGNEFFKQGKFPEAKAEYDEGVRRAPNEAKMYSNRSAALMKLLELPGALKDAEKSLELDPTAVKVWARKGNILVIMKDYNKAMAAFQKGLEIEPDNAQCIQGMLQVQEKIQATSSSDTIDEEQVRRAMDDPDVQAILMDPQFRLTLSGIQENPSRLQEALKDPTMALKLQKLIAAGILKVQ